LLIRVSVGGAAHGPRAAAHSRLVAQEHAARLQSESAAAAAQVQELQEVARQERAKRELDAYWREDEEQRQQQMEVELARVRAVCAEQ
jgi:hypothetical protein